MMKVGFTQQLKPGEFGQRTQECDTYKYETHPVTGLIALSFYEVSGPGSRLKGVVTGIVQFQVEYV